MEEEEDDDDHYQCLTATIATIASNDFQDDDYCYCYCCCSDDGYSYRYGDCYCCTLTTTANYCSATTTATTTTIVPDHGYRSAISLRWIGSGLPIYACIHISASLPQNPKP